MSDIRSSLTRRELIKVGGITLVVSMSPPGFCTGSLAAVAPMRKNIDALSTDELETYKHAVGILIQRGTANPANMEGYAWQAALHNDFERERPDGSIGACEHRSELFFPWHRAHLAGFEFLLRATDGPRTANVTIPYWDWTTPASGVRFPKAFEDESSPLFHAGRYRQVTPGTPRIQWDADEVKTKMVQEPDWLLFAGEPLDAQGQGGSFGWVEDGPHNATHGDIGPTMGDPETASRDPIYWSFHAYIDLIWARWQKVHTDATHPQPFTAPQTKVWVEPFTPQVGDMAQTDTLPVGYAYGYDYDFSIDQAPIMVGSSSQPVQRTLEAARSGERVVTTAPLRVGRANRHLLRVRDVAVLPDVTYSIRAYVHPPSLDVRTAGQAERDRYLADTATVWMSGGHAHHPTNVILDLTKAIAPFADKEFEITVLSETRPLPQSAAEMESARVDLNRKVAASGPLWRSLVLEER